MSKHIFSLHAIAVLVLATSSCSGGSGKSGGPTEPPHTQKPVAELSAPANVWSGESFSIISRGQNASDGCTRSWTQSTSQGEQTDVITAGAPGTYEYTITCRNGANTSTKSVTVTVKRPLISGQVFGVLPGPLNLSGLEFFATNGSQTARGPVNPSTGQFSVETRLIAENCLNMGLEYPGVNSNSVFGSISRICDLGFESSQKFLALPRNWRISNGKNVGASVNIDLMATFKVSGDGYTSFFDENWDDRANGWSFAIASIPRNMRPIKVAIDWGKTDEPIDSLVVQTAIDSINSHFGEHFKMTDFSQLGAQSGVRLSVDKGWPAIASAGYWKNAGNDIVGGAIVYGSGSYVSVWGTMHELIHIMGRGHTCSWKSVMYTGCPTHLDLQAKWPSREDVAYSEFLDAIREAEKRTGAMSGLIAAYNSERVRLGIEPHWPAATTTVSGSASVLPSEGGMFWIHEGPQGKMRK